MRCSGNGENNMNRKNSLSAIIIAKNEAMRIATCIDALAFCDEVLVADNGSTDETVAVSRAHGAHIAIFSMGDFAELRNAAAKRATGEWLLYVDADEVVSAPLAREIRRAIDTWSQQKPTSYRLCRTNYYLGQRWPGNERMLRLFRRTALKGWKGELHETAVTDGAIGDLPGELIHDTHRSLEEMVRKTNDWSETEALLRLHAGHPSISWWRLLRVAITGFGNSYFRQGGWRAGTVGWVESIYQAFSLFITYAKLWELQNRKSVEDTHEHEKTLI